MATNRTKQRDKRQDRGSVKEEAGEGATNNVVLVAGRVRIDPVIRSMPNDDLLLTFDLVCGAGDQLRTVPVSWLGRPRSVPNVKGDDELMVLGTVQRRFFRVGGATANVVDVRAEKIARTPASKRNLRQQAATRLGSEG